MGVALILDQLKLVLGGVARGKVVFDGAVFEVAPEAIRLHIVVLLVLHRAHLH